MMAVPNEQNETPPMWMLLFSIGGILAVGGRAGIHLCWYLLTAHLAATALWLIISVVRGRARHNDHRTPKGDDELDGTDAVPRISWQPTTTVSSGRSRSHDGLKRNAHNGNLGALNQSDASPIRPALPKRTPRGKRRSKVRRKRPRSYMQKK